jgi:uroporphyrinogen-III synthase
LFSPSAIRLFAKAYTFDGLKVAVLGKGSKKAAESLGISVSFCAKSADPAEAVAEFADQLKASETVIAASSDKSLKRLETVVPSAQLIDWPFYRNRPQSNIPQADSQYLIFTSPSNARAYFGPHSLQKSQQVVAIGRSTKECLSEMGISAFVADNPTEKGIWEVVTEAI